MTDDKSRRTIIILKRIMDSEFSQLGLILANKKRKKGRKAKHVVRQRLIAALPFHDMTKKETRGDIEGRRTSGGEIRRARKGKV